MTPDGKNGNGVIKLAIPVAALIVVAQVVLALAKPSNPAAGVQVQISERLGKLEEGMRRLDGTPEKVSALTEATLGLKAGMERIEKKLDSHVDRGK